MVNKATGDFAKEIAAFEKSAASRREQTAKLLKSKPELLVLSDFGASLSVKGNALIACDGVSNKETYEVHPGYSPARRIVWIGYSGSITIDALYWCREHNLSIIILDEYGESLLTTCPKSSTDGKIRRLQYTRSDDESLAFAKFLIREKIDRQANNLETHTELPGGASSALTVRRHIMATGQATSTERLMQVEGQAAAVYFDGWINWSIPWRSGATKFPEHWKKYQGRAKPSTHKARHAADPANAMLNFSYGILASRLDMLLTADGIDSACGVLHADRDGRASLVYDLIEPLRPKADDVLLSFIEKQKLLPGDFIKENNGTVKLSPQFARLLSVAVDIPADELKQIVNQYKQYLFS